MYEQHFGLQKRPLSPTATGSDVFVGPQTAKTMAGFRRALATQDAVVTVSGPVGAGKTTLTTRALDSIGVKHKTVRVGRMHMDSSDVLESLLVVLGVKERPAGTIQRFAAFRKKLKSLQDRDVRVFIVVEDVSRTGPETLAELEALTAADAGESDGASIILMGDERLPEFMRDPIVGQLQQRVRQRHTIMPLCAAELRGYMRHCFRLAGGDFDQIFDGQSPALIHELSNGIPRVANNIVDSVLIAAAEHKIRPVPAELVAKVASDEYGLSADDFDFSSPVSPAPMAEPVAKLEPEAVQAPEPGLEMPAATAPEPEVKAAIEPEPLSAVAPEPVPESQPEVLEEPQPVIVFADETDELADHLDDLPELIQDTLPDLTILSPQFATLEKDVEDEIPDLVVAPDPKPVAEIIPELEAMPEPTPEPVAELIPELEAMPEPDPEPVADVIPELEAIPELELEPVAAVVPEPGDVPEPAALESPVEEIPEWDRDPTLAELRPDLDALEQAMAFAHSGSIDTAKPAVEDNAGEKAEIPEIILDEAIRTGIEKHEVEEPADIRPPNAAKKVDPELDRIAADIANAKSIEDFDDKMAETLFGTEISMIAAQVIASGSVDEPANDALQLEPEASSLPEPIPEISVEAEPVAVRASEEVSLETPTPGVQSGMDVSASQRLKTVRALNADLHPSLREPEEPNGGGSGAEASPESIEDQINTSITQTLKALKVPAHLIDAEPEEEPKKGLFSRFRRS